MVQPADFLGGQVVLQPVVHPLREALQRPFAGGGERRGLARFGGGEQFVHLRLDRVQCLFGASLVGGTMGEQQCPDLVPLFVTEVIRIDARLETVGSPGDRGRRGQCGCARSDRW